MCGKATRDDANAASDSLPRGSGGPPLIQISLRSPLIFYTDKSLERCEEVVWGAGWTDGTQRAEKDRNHSCAGQCSRHIGQRTWRERERGGERERWERGRERELGREREVGER